MLAAYLIVFQFIELMHRLQFYGIDAKGCQVVELLH
jgi:hypothetical protein